MTGFSTPHIETQNAWVEFPIFDAKARSLKKAFLGKAGGTIDVTGNSTIDGHATLNGGFVTVESATLTLDDVTLAKLGQRTWRREAPPGP